MEALEATMKKHNINLDFSSFNFSSHGHALFAFGFSFNATSTLFSNEWLNDSGASYYMAKDKVIFVLLMNVTPNKYFLVL
jgi:hypothetical protein